MEITRFQPAGDCPHEHGPQVTRGRIRPPATGFGAALRADPVVDLTPTISFSVTRRELAAAQRIAAHRQITVEQLTYTALMRVVLGDGSVPDPHRPAA